MKKFLRFIISGQILIFLFLFLEVVVVLSLDLNIDDEGGIQPLNHRKLKDQ